VRCLIQLDRAVEAAENLELALKYGAAPLEENVYAEAIAYQKLLANQVGEVAVKCEQPGVASRSTPRRSCNARVARASASRPAATS